LEGFGGAVGCFLALEGEGGAGGRDDKPRLPGGGGGGGGGGPGGRGGGVCAIVTLPSLKFCGSFKASLF